VQAASFHPALLRGDVGLTNRRRQTLDRANACSDAEGLMLPATAEADGYVVEKAKGNVGVIPAEGTFRCHLEFGALTPEDAAGLRQHIEEIMTARHGFGNGTRSVE
jgi:hypothetical protein